MARDWIKWVKGLSQRREVLMLARTLGISRREAACACMEMWAWADGETLDGNIKGATGEDIDELLGLPGFAVALQAPEVGWLVVRANGITFPRYERNNGETAKRRATEAHKKSRTRDLRRSDTSRKCPPARPLSVRTRAGPEKRREELKPPPPTPSVPNPSAPDPAPLSAAWSEAVVVLRGCGVGDAEAACESARDRGATPGEVRWICEHFTAHPGAWTAGLLHSMVSKIRAGEKIRWPTPLPEYVETQRKASVETKHSKWHEDNAKQIRERAERAAERERIRKELEEHPVDLKAELQKAVAGKSSEGSAHT